MALGSLRGQQVVALLMMIAALLLIVLTKGRCSRAVGGYFEQLDKETGPPAPPAPARKP